MPVPLIDEQLSTLILAAAWQAQQSGALPEGLLPVQAPLKQPKNPAWGDYSTSLALQWAKVLERPPLEVAEAIRRHLPASELVASTSVTAPGFVNLTLDPAWVARQVEAILAAGSRFGDHDFGKGRQAQVEFVSANPTGPLSVGRGRGAVLGDTLANLLEAVGWVVTREYYFNNTGRQMRALGESLERRYLQALGQEVEILEEMYQGAYLVELGRELVRTQGDRLVLSGWKVFKEIAEQAMFASIQRTLERLNINIDIFFNEASLYADTSVEEVLDLFDQKGLLYDRDGATWLALTQLGGPEDRVVVRANGEPTYRLPDIAYHRNKLQRGFELIIDVLGADHKDAFPDVMRGVEALGYDTSGIKLVMNQFVTLKGERMSTRAGRFTRLDELIDAAGADAVRYFMLMRSPESHLEFDLELAVEQSEKNPVYYVQYAYTRIASLLRRAAEQGYVLDGPPDDGQTALLVHPSEQALIRQLLQLPSLVARLAKELAPHPLTTYAHDLASAFHVFYRDCLVIDTAAPGLSQARLHLVQAAQLGLARTLALIGVSAPEKM